MTTLPMFSTFRCTICRGLPGLGLLLAVALLVSGCDQAKLDRPEPPPPGDQFDTYVALGNSITASFQSAGINAQTQGESYAVKVAQQIGTEFHSPLLEAPGCPPPLTNPFTGERESGGSSDTCALRQRPIPSILHNVAVPGAQVIDVLENLNEDSNANELTLLLLGGRTQIQAAAQADPTFVTLWIGNNDVLGAALSGDASRITSTSTFQARYSTVLDSLDDIGVEGGTLIGVSDVTLAPHFSPGAAYWQAEQNGQLPPTFSVDQSCSPDEVGTSTLVPFRYGFGTLLAQAQAGQSVTLDCSQDPPVLTGTEIQSIKGAVASYNAFIEQQADARGWAYVDVNPIFQALRTSGEIPSFPNTDSPSEAFGAYFSLDGVHPSGLGHDVVANEVIEEINATFDTSIEPLSDVPDVPNSFTSE